MMKNIFKKSLCIAVLSVMLAVLMAFQAPVMRVSAAGDPYISDLQIIVAKDYNEAKTKATKGYTVVQEPLCAPNKEQGDTGDSTFLCYKTTDKKDDAIFDIKSVTMGDGYSYSKYASYLEEQYDFAEQIVKTLAPAILEYRQNYSRTAELSVIVHDLLSYFYENDSGKTVAELFDTLKFKKGKLDSDGVECLIPLFMQGNIDFIIVIEALLLIACSDGQSQSWTEYLDAIADDGSTLPLSEDMDYSDEVKLFKRQIPEIQSDIKYYLNCEKDHPFTPEIEAEMNAQEETFQIERAKPENKTVSDTQLRKSIAAAKAEKEPNGIGAKYLEFYTWRLEEGADRALKWGDGKKLYEGLKSYNYPLAGYDTLYDLIMKDPDTTNKTDYYPIMSSLTEGQRASLVLGAKQMLMVSFTEPDQYIEELESWMEEQDVFSWDEPISVYEGVDRSLYDPDGIAMTEHVLDYLRYGTESPFDSTLSQRVHNALSILHFIAGGIAGLAVATGLVIFFTSVVMATAKVIVYQMYFIDCLCTAINSFSEVLFPLLYVTIAALIIVAIVIIVDKFWDNPDKKYTAIPRVMCSREDSIYTGIDENGNDVFGGGYVYYYGVKNPNQPASIDAGEQKDLDTSNQVMDIYNWQLSGTDRHWIALYYSKDQRLAYLDQNQKAHRLNPIKAGSLTVSTKELDDASPVSDFLNTICDTMFWYQRTNNEWKDTSYRYLYKTHYTDSEFRDLVENYVSASVFANNEALAFGGGGLVLGAIGGTFVTLAAKKKKKDTVTEQA